MWEAVAPVQLQEVCVNSPGPCIWGPFCDMVSHAKPRVPITSLPTCHWSGALRTPFYSEACLSLAPVN